MEKIILIDGRDVGFKVPASLPIRYRNMTGRDYYVDMQRMAESMEEETEPNKVAARRKAKELFAKKPKDAKEEPEKVMRFTDQWDTTIMYFLIHAMAKAADPSINPDTIEWVDSFEDFPVFEIFASLQDLLVKSTETTKK